MQKQGELLDQMIQDKEEKEREAEEARMELGAKEAEVVTIRSYFERAEAEKEKLESENAQLRKA